MALRTQANQIIFFIIHLITIHMMDVKNFCFTTFKTLFSIFSFRNIISFFSKFYKDFIRAHKRVIAILITKYLVRTRNLIKEISAVFTDSLFSLFKRLPNTFSSAINRTIFGSTNSFICGFYNFINRITSNTVFGNGFSTSQTVAFPRTKFRVFARDPNKFLSTKITNKQSHNTKEYI